MGRTKEFDYRGSSSEFLMNLMIKKIYGIEPGDFVQEHALRIKSEKELEQERIKHEKILQQERIKKEKELEQERLKVVMQLRGEGQTAVRIADVLNYDLAWVEKSIKPKRKK